MSEDNEKEALISLTADIVAAHVGNNNVSVADIPALIANVHDALSALGRVSEAPTKDENRLSGAVSIRKSTADPAYILSMIDGKPYKSLKRHISRHGYTVESYKAAFGLPASYPMVSPDYSKHRRKVAIDLGLGRKANAAAPNTSGDKAAKAKSAAKPRTLKSAVAAAKSHLGGK